MDRDRFKFVYAGALIVLVIELLIIINNYFDGNLYAFRGQEADAIEPLLNRAQPDFFGFLSLTWSALLGTVGLGVLFVYRLIRGVQPLLELLATALWVIELYFLYTESKPFLNINMANYDFFKFIWAYLLAFLGITAMLAVVIRDLLNRKKA